MTLTHWTIRIALLCYVMAVALRSRTWWTLGCASYLAHVAAAFQFVYGWSNEVAYRETAKQAWGFGAGLYVNYAFTLVWIIDCVWWWKGSRPRWFADAIQWFFAFMFFNATVVFAAGAIRWIGAAATVGLLLLHRNRHRVARDV